MTHCFKKVGLLAALALVSLSVAAGIDELPTKTINGKTYHYYEVQPKETVYSLCKRFDISRDELIRYNPSVEDGLKANQTLLFPVDAAAQNGQMSEYMNYMVQKNETGYGISRKFDMSLEEFYKLNPSAKDGLKAGETVKVRRGSVKSDASDKQQDKSAESQKPVSQRSEKSYVIPAGATLYQIAKEHDVTVQQILDANPGLDANRYAVGQVIVIPAAGSSDQANNRSCESAETKSPVVPTTNGTYVVKDGDTFYGIAHTHGIAVEQLREANSAIDVLQPGMMIVIPQGCDENNIARPASPSKDVEPAGPVVTPTVPSTETGDTIVIAVALPFNASAEKRDARSVRAIEFYRGLVLALDSLREFGRPVRLLTYDTKGTLDGANAIIADNSLKQADLIIGPDAADQLGAFSKFAADNNINLLNLFVIKDKDYLTNPYMMNSNIPHDVMYEKSIDYLMRIYPDVVPVFIKRKNGKQDKEEYVGLFQKKLSEAGRKYHVVDYNDKLTASVLSKLPEGENYAFIPNTSNMSEFQTFIDAILTYRESNAGAGTPALWGYSEWLTARGQNLKKLNDVNTIIFSRFYSVEKDSAEESLQNSFRQWYGTSIMDKIPKQGTYGFDTGLFLINALNANEGDFSRFTPVYNGIQNAYDFVRVPSGGWVNNEMFMINFAPSGIISKFGI